MPIVFVHGVSNRPGDTFNQAVRQREAFFRETVCRTILNNPHATILQPNWGGLVPDFPRENPIVPPVKPGDGFMAFGAGAEPLGGLAGVDNGLPAVVLGPKPAGNQRVLAVARRSFPEAVDLLWHEAARGSQVRGHEDREAELLAAGILAAAYAEENPKPRWVEEVADDPGFIEELVKELKKLGQSPPADTPTPAPTVEALGVTDRVFGWLQGAKDAVARKVVDLPNDALLRAFRPGFSKGLVDFFGDVFFYQTYRGTKAEPREIIRAILEPLRQAREEANDKAEKLVVVGHSMGGNILYDLLTHFDDELSVDALVTVGCQASLFKQLKLFRIQESGQYPAGTKAPKPPRVGRWFNIFDPQDLLSFAFEPEFEGVEDFFFESPGGILGAHGDYFQRIRFYERLVARLR